MNFIDFAASHGLRITDLIADNRWHRCPTEGKPRKKNGAYVFDGERGAVIDFATMTKAAAFRNGSRAGFIDKAALRANQAISRAQERAKHDEARKRAQAILDTCSIERHPYLAAKGFPNEMMPVLHDSLVVPMRSFANYKQLNSLQFISAAGDKRFYPGGQAKGSVFEIGPWRAREWWLVEGYATALSVRAALETMHREVGVIVCFSAGNLAHVGRLVKAKGVRAYVFADNDASGAGAKAAEETGLPWLMAPEVGLDANDWHQRHGIAELAKLIRNRAHNPGPHAGSFPGRRSTASGAFDREG